MASRGRRLISIYFLLLHPHAAAFVLSLLAMTPICRNAVRPRPRSLTHTIYAATATESRIRSLRRQPQLPEHIRVDIASLKISKWPCTWLMCLSAEQLQCM